MTIGNLVSLHEETLPGYVGRPSSTGHTLKMRQLHSSTVYLVRGQSLLLLRTNILCFILKHPRLECTLVCTSVRVFEVVLARSCFRAIINFRAPSTAYSIHLRAMLHTSVK